MANGKKQEDKMDMQAMMEVYKKLATPGAPHKMLASLEGSWITKTRAWMEPDKPPMESTGACEQKMLLEGRYLQQEYTSEMMGSPFTGLLGSGLQNCNFVIARKRGDDGWTARFPLPAAGRSESGPGYRRRWLAPRCRAV